LQFESKSSILSSFFVGENILKIISLAPPVANWYSSPIKRLLSSVLTHSSVKKWLYKFLEMALQVYGRKILFGAENSSFASEVTEFPSKLAGLPDFSRHNTPKGETIY
jgi:hypothetical protein